MGLGTGVWLSWFLLRDGIKAWELGFHLEAQGRRPLPRALGQVAVGTQPLPALCPGSLRLQAGKDT